MYSWLLEKDYVAVICNKGKRHNNLILMRNFKTEEWSWFDEFYLLN